MIGLCPRCNDQVLEGKTDFFCRSSDCGFKFGGVILGQVISQAQAFKLLAKGQTDLLDGFISKSGKRFSAYLVMDKAGKVTFEFPDKNSDSQEERKTKRDEEMVCRPLLNAATKRLFQNNAFRITGLPVDASSREITKHSEKLKMLAELEQIYPGAQSAFALNPPPSIDEIREAIQKLKDPEIRMVDEFFWFWPANINMGETDPAIQALVNNDSNTACRLWSEREKIGSDGTVARHNLAILWHLRALEDEIRTIKENGQESSNLEQYWRQAFTYWKHLVEDDHLVVKLGERIRQIGDPRLTEEFALSLIRSLPNALDKINAELALIHAERGNIGMARLHIQFIRYNIRGIDNVEKMADLILTPSKNRIREQIQQTKQTSDANPDAADAAARNLLKQARPVLDLFKLFYSEHNNCRNDFFDDIANVITDCAVSHQRKTDDNKTFVFLLQEAQSLAASQELRLRINKNIKIGKGNISYERFKPIREILREIQNSDEPLHEKLIRLKNEVLQKFKLFESDGSTDTDIIAERSTEIAWVLRTLSIAAHNNHDDTDMALEMIHLANQLARDSEAQKKIAEDIKQLTKIKRDQDAHSLQLKVRNDNVEVTQAGIRYNDHFISTKDITAIRFGIGNMVIIAEISLYTLEIRSQDGNEIKIDFKKILRSEELARKDLNATLQALFYHVIPSLSARIAKSIKSGQDQQLGECWLTKSGIRGSVGALLWKGEVIVPWADVRFGTANGYLAIRSTQNRSFHKTFGIRTVWNAGIFEEIIKKI